MGHIGEQRLNVVLLHEELGLDDRLNTAHLLALLLLIVHDLLEHLEDLVVLGSSFTLTSVVITALPPCLQTLAGQVEGQLVALQVVIIVSRLHVWLRLIHVECFHHRSSVVCKCAKMLTTSPRAFLNSN